MRRPYSDKGECSSPAAVKGGMVYPLAARLRVIGEGSERTPNHRTAVIHKVGIADNTAMGLFTVTTADEAGSTDGGAYVCRVTVLIRHSAVSNAGAAAVKAVAARFSRAMDSSGSGALSAVVEEYDDAPASTNAPARSIGNVALTVTEDSEYSVTVSIQIDLTGSAAGTAEVVALVELFWTGFLTTPEIAPV